MEKNSELQTDAPLDCINAWQDTSLDRRDGFALRRPLDAEPRPMGKDKGVGVGNT